MPLLDYIEKHYGGNQSAFARACGVSPAQVTQWLKAEFIVYDGSLYSKRKQELPQPMEKK